MAKNRDVSIRIARLLQDANITYITQAHRWVSRHTKLKYHNYPNYGDAFLLRLDILSKLSENMAAHPY